MGCCHCRYLYENDKKEGICSGAIYYCSKQKKYVNGIQDSCSEYSKDYSKTIGLSNEIYEEGRKYCNDDRSPMFYLVILVVMLILSMFIHI